MAPTSSNNVTGYTPAQKQQLLDLARSAIQKRLQGEPFTVPTGDYPASLRVPRATFVTLHVDAQLHGCIGTLDARRPLVEDVAHNARAAAFEDLRFPALTAPELERLPDHISVLRVPRATFVTLHVDAQLHGCIGTLEARRPLVEDVAHNARAAAFEDPRFPALTAPEFERLQIHISVLGVPEPIQFDSEEGLLRQLRPHVDGLILEAGPHRGTFLPAVWDELPAPQDFLRHLKRKAGLPADYWSRDLRVRRYTVESIP